MYNKSEFYQIRASYRSLFGGASEKLQKILWPETLVHDWQALTSPISKDISYDDFQKMSTDVADLSAELSRDWCLWRNRLDGAGARYAELVKDGVGYSIGLNPWCDFLSLKYHDVLTQPGARLVVVMGYNWYPMVVGYDDRPELPDPPLKKRDPASFNGNRYRFVFETPAYCRAKVVPIFLNLFPFFTAPGREAT